MRGCDLSITNHTSLENYRKCKDFHYCNVITLQVFREVIKYNDLFMNKNQQCLSTVLTHASLKRFPAVITLSARG